jgi:hypothetical protein
MRKEWLVQYLDDPAFGYLSGWLQHYTSGHTNLPPHRNGHGYRSFEWNRDIKLAWSYNDSELTVIYGSDWKKYESHEFIPRYILEDADVEIGQVRRAIDANRL